MYLLDMSQCVWYRKKNVLDGYLKNEGSNFRQTKIKVV